MNPMPTICGDVRIDAPQTALDTRPLGIPGLYPALDGSDGRSMLSHRHPKPPEQLSPRYQMSKAPAFQFYPERFVMGCAFMSTADVGCYILMMCHQWEHGGLPNDPKALQRICKSVKPVSAMVMEKFEIGEDGLLRNAVLEDTRNKQDTYRQRIGALRSEAAKKKWEKARSCDAIAVQVQSTSNASIEIETGVKKVRKERAKGDDRFEALWVAYERDGSKGKAIEYWNRLPEEDKQAVEAKVAAYIQSTPGGEFRFNLEGWINPDERRWERPIRLRVAAQAAPMTKQEADRHLAQWRIDNGRAPGSAVTYEEMPKDLRDFYLKKTA